VARLPRRPLVYDAGALIAAQSRDRAIAVLHSRAIERGRVAVVPSPVLAQVWRGGGARQASLAFLLRGCTIDAPGEQVAKFAGTLLGRTGTSDAVDAIVVAAAALAGAEIVTSDPGDLRALADASGRRIALIEV
jgi:hypothetical protein